MNSFCTLYDQLNNLADVRLQSEYVGNYLDKVNDKEGASSIFLLRGGQLKKLISSAELIKLACAQASFSMATYERCLDFTTDAIEAISLMLPVRHPINNQDLPFWLEQINSIDVKDKSEVTHFILESWDALRADERYIFNKIISKTWRSPINSINLAYSLSQYFNITAPQQAYNLQNTSIHDISTIQKLSDPKRAAKNILPVEFIKPTLLENLDDLEHPSEYLCTSEWNGVRAQLITGDVEIALWSARNELISNKFPELLSVAAQLPKNTIIDGVIMANIQDSIQPKSVVRKRLARKKITPKISESIPLFFCAIDLIRLDNVELADLKLIERQNHLEALIQEIPFNHIIQLSDNIECLHWDGLQEKWPEIKSINSSAVIIKHKQSHYNSNSIWHKFKAAPYRAKGILLYVKRGEGGRSNQYVEFTLGAQAGGKIIPFVKVQPRFLDDEHLAIKKFVKENLIERFGPVYSVTAKLVFEVSFESVQSSKRHKCGFILKHPNFIEWNKEETIDDVANIEFFVDKIV